LCGGHAMEQEHKLLSAAEYRQRALECSKKADGVKEPLIRDMFQQMADEWTFVADQVERLSKLPR
jgi:hypothetical protein